jgi:hypothetical protein
MGNPRSIWIKLLFQLCVDIEGAEVQIKDGVSNETKNENGKKQNGDGEEELCASTTDPPRPSQTL